MKKVRQLHLYMGTLFAPLIIFFSLTGILQTLELHEGAGTPNWIEQIASIHKNQALQSDEPKQRRPPASGAQKWPDRSQSKEVEKEVETEVKAEGDGDEAQDARGPSPWPLKWFVVLMSVGLTVTTGLGIYLSFKYERNKGIVWGLLVAGTLLPLALLWV